MLRCTKKLQKVLGVKQPDISEEIVDSSPLGSWYANLIEINGSQCILFVNEKTLFNFLIPEPHQNQANQLKETFKSYLRCILADEDFDIGFIDKLMDGCSNIEYANK